MVTKEYQYLGSELVETPFGIDHVFDDGSIRKSECHAKWYDGKEEVDNLSDAKKRVAILKKMDKY